MRHGQPASPSCSRTRQAACTGNYDEPPGRQRCLRRLLVHPTRPSRRPCPWRPCSRGCQRCRGRRGRMGTRLSHCVNLTARACSLSKPAKLSYGAHTHGLMRLAHGAGGPGEGTPGPRRQHLLHNFYIITNILRLNSCISCGRRRASGRRRADGSCLMRCTARPAPSPAMWSPVRSSIRCHPCDR